MLGGPGGIIITRPIVIIPRKASRPNRALANLTAAVPVLNQSATVLIQGCFDCDDFSRVCFDSDDLSCGRAGPVSAVQACPSQYLRCVESVGSVYQPAGGRVAAISYPGLPSKPSRSSVYS